MINHAALALHVIRKVPDAPIVVMDVPLQYPLPNRMSYPSEFVSSLPFVGETQSPELLIYGLKVLDISVFRGEITRHDERITFDPQDLPFLGSCYVFEFIDQLCTRTPAALLQKTVYAYEDTAYVFDRSHIATDRAGAILAGLVRHIGDIIHRAEHPSQPA